MENPVPPVTRDPAGPDREGPPASGVRGPALNVAVGAPLMSHVVVRPGAESYWRALKEVRDPELPISVVDMGLIYDIRVEDEGTGSRLSVTMTFTATACPCMELMLMDVEERLLAEPAVRSVSVEVVWDPPWNRTMITDEGRAKLREYGVAA